MKNLCIGFSTSTSWLSRAIMWFTKSQASHSFFCVEANGKRLVIGADWNGLVVQTWERFVYEGNKLVGMQQFAGALDSQIPWVLEQLDTGYDYLGLFGGVWMMMVRRLFRRPKEPNPWGSPWRLFCSEACAEMLVRAQWGRAGAALSPRSTTPQDLMNFFWGKT